MSAKIELIFVVAIMTFFLNSCCTTKVVICPDGRPVTYSKSSNCAIKNYKVAVKDFKVNLKATINVIDEVSIGVDNAEVKNESKLLREKLDQESIRFQETLKASYLALSSDPCNNSERHYKLVESINSNNYKLQELKLNIKASKDDELVNTIKKGIKIKFNIPRTNILQRNKIVNKLREIVIRDVRNYIKQNSKYDLKDSAIKSNTKIISSNLKNYLGDNYYKTVNGNINNESEIFLFNVASIKLKNDERVNYGPALGYHSKNGIVKIIQFSEYDNPKIIYTSECSEEKVDYNRVKKIIISIFKNGIQKEIDRIYNN